MKFAFGFFVGLFTGAGIAISVIGAFVIGIVLSDRRNRPPRYRAYSNPLSPNLNRREAGEPRVKETPAT